MLDNKPPDHLSIKINNGVEITNSTLVILSLTAKDSGSGVSLMSFSPDGENWTGWENFTKTKSYNLFIKPFFLTSFLILNIKNNGNYNNKNNYCYF